MTLNLKKHFKYQLWVCFLTFVFMAYAFEKSIVDIRFYSLFLLISCIFLGLFNTVYYTHHFFAKKLRENFLYIILFIFTFGFIWFGFTIISLPIMALEFSSIILKDIYYGENATALNESYKKYKKFDIENKQAQDIYASYKRSKRIIAFLKYGLIGLCLFVNSIVADVMPTDAVIDVVGIIIALFLVVIYFILKNTIMSKIYQRTLSIIQDQCDANLYCMIFEYLYNLNYQYNDAIYYIVGLRWAGRDDEIEKILRRHINHRKTLQYKLCLYSCLGKKSEVTDRLYEDIKKQFNKHINKGKSSEKWKADDLYIDILNALKSKDYQEGLRLIEQLKKSPFKANQVRDSYNKALCLYKTGDKEQAKDLFEWVVFSGNNLIYVKYANEYLKKYKKT